MHDQTVQLPVHPSTNVKMANCMLQKLITCMLGMVEVLHVIRKDNHILQLLCNQSLCILVEKESTDPKNIRLWPVNPLESIKAANLVLNTCESQYDLGSSQLKCPWGSLLGHKSSFVFSAIFGQYQWQYQNFTELLSLNLVAFFFLINLICIIFCTFWMTPC